MKNLKKSKLASTINFKKLQQSELTKMIGGTKSLPMEHPTIVCHISCDDCTEVHGDV